MSKPNEELGRRWVALKCWRWMVGMKWIAPGPRGLRLIGRVSGKGFPYVATGAVPDVADPATRGCLLALMRESQGDPSACVVSSRGGERWSVWSKGYDVTGVSASCEVSAMLEVVEFNERGE